MKGFAMCSKSSLCVVLALFAVGSLLVGSASATALYIPNQSFDDQVLADGDNTAPVGATDWDPTGWHGAGTGLEWHAVMNAKDNNFPGTTGLPGVPTGGTGQNVYFMYGYAKDPVNHPDLSSYELLSGSLGTLAVGTYTLTAAVGVETGILTIPEHSDYGLAIGTLESGELKRQMFSGATSPTSSFSDVSMTMDVLPGDAHVLAGEHYYVKLIGQNTDNGLAQEVAWDNIRLNGPVSTPEPGTLAILASGLIGLVCYAWRKRK
jgi:hypothetical protein